MNSAISMLKHQLSAAHALSAKNSEGEIITLPDFSKFRQRIAKMEVEQDFKKEITPPSEKIKQAINKLNIEKEELTSNEWRLVFWGLNEKSSIGRAVINEDRLLKLVSNRVLSLIENKKLLKRDWTALCSSYFSYVGEVSENRNQWLELRSLIIKSFNSILQTQRKPKAWSELIKNNTNIFTDNANTLIGNYLISGEQKTLEELTSILPIPDHSWLWSQVFSKLLKNLELLTDEEFSQSIPPILELIKSYPLYKDFILAALLKRYFNSIYRKISNQDLKEITLLTWGSPQIKSDKNRWLTNVSEDELAMAMRWFARDDLEHFFKLLQGANGVDQRRLNFWLNYVDQILYTRIVMGSDALYNRSTDFKDFREKNKGRFSALLNAPFENNAFVIKIKEYWFVEFSETSNACYVYTDEKLPFKPDLPRLDMRLELKNKNKSLHTIIHRADWEYTATSYLKGLGIYKEKSSTLSSYSNDVNHAINESKKILAGFDFSINDNRIHGGFYRIHVPIPIFNIDKPLKALGFEYVAGEGYLIK